MTNQTWLAQMDQKTPNGYQCDKEPGYYEEKDGWKVVTALSKIQVKNEKTGDTAEYSPHLYQSSMHPEQMQIRTLTVGCRGEEVYIEAPYDKKMLHPEETIVGVEPYLPEIIKPDCLHCCNCGRCSY